MSKHFTFSDCVSYAIEHNIAFNLYYYSDMGLHYIYSDMSDGYDGYLTATQAIFKWDNFAHEYKATMNLNIRLAYKKDYELMHRLVSALNNKDGMKHVKATWNNGVMHWYGALCLNNEHYVSASTIHGNGVWHGEF